MSSERVIVVGASGFGREALDSLEAMIAAGNEVDLLGVVDDSPSDFNRDVLANRGTALLGGFQRLLKADADVRYVLGIGAPQVRRQLVAQLDAQGRRPFTVVHPNAAFGARSVPGWGAVICAGAAVSGNVRFGQHVHINPNATVGHDAILRDFVSINPAATISGNVDVGAGTLVGAGAIVLQDLSIGEDALIGAGAVVTKGVPGAVVVKGVPGTWATVRVDPTQGRVS